MTYERTLSSNLECWNDPQFSWNQTSQNLQSNWSNSDPSLPSIDINYNFEDTQKLVDEVLTRPAEIDSTYHYTH